MCFEIPDPELAKTELLSARIDPGAFFMGGGECFWVTVAFLLAREKLYHDGGIDRYETFDGGLMRDSHPYLPPNGILKMIEASLGEADYRGHPGFLVFWKP